MTLFSNTKYLSKDPAADLAFVKASADSSLGQARNRFMSLFRREQAFFVVHLSNIDVASIPKSVTASETSLILREVWDTGGKEAAAATPWLVKGTEDRTEPRAQLVQHIRALQYLDSYDGEMTPSVIQEAHRILLDGSYDVRDVARKMLCTGEFRLNSSCNGALDARV